MDIQESSQVQFSKIEELEQRLKQCQVELVESNDLLVVKENKVKQLEKDLKTQANLLELEYQLKHEEDVIENKAINKKLEKLVKENDDQKTKLGLLYEGLEKLAVEPSAEEDNTSLTKAYKATQVLHCFLFKDLF